MSGGRASVLVVGLLVRVGTAGADPCATATGSVSGTVVRRADLAPLAGARVRVQGCLGAPVVSDATGAFTLAVPAGPVVVAGAAGGHYDGCAKQPLDAPDCTTAQAGATGLTIALDPLPTDDDPAYVYRTPEACDLCHHDIVADWNRSTMAHTNRNRWVDNLYNGTDVTMPPGPPPDPNDPPFFAFLARHNPNAAQPLRRGECANCHQPEYVAADPTNTSFNQFTGADRHGITCDFCHKITDVDVSPGGLARPNLVHGKTTMLRSPSEPWLELGPLDDVTFPGVPDMRASAAAIVTSSRLCASCHEDNTDPRDANGNFKGTYDGPASQQTYSEWAASPAAALGIQCRDCHMVPTGRTSMCNRTSNVRDPSQVRSHLFEGTTPDFLRRAVRLRAAAAVKGETLAVTVDVANVGAGHHVPTGVTLRNLILVVSAHDKADVRLEQASGPKVPNWGGVGDPANGAFAALPGKGYARVLVDEFLAENVLFTEAVEAFDNRIPAGATDTTSYTFVLPKNWRKRDVRVETTLYYRRAFKPTADQRKWNVPLGANPHGTRGDGSDYDENVVMGRVVNALACKGALGRVRAIATGGHLDVSATLKLPARTTLDPTANGVQVALGDPAHPSALALESVSGFTTSGHRLQFAGDAAGTVRTLRFTPAGRRAYRMTLALGGLDPAGLTQSRLLLDLDSGDACFRKTLRCKVTGGTTRCR